MLTTPCTRRDRGEGRRQKHRVSGTSDETADAKAVNEHIVDELAACEQLSDHVQIGSDRPGCIEHGLVRTRREEPSAGLTPPT